MALVRGVHGCNEVLEAVVEDGPGRVGICESPIRDVNIEDTL